MSFFIDENRIYVESQTDLQNFADMYPEYVRMMDTTADIELHICYNMESDSIEIIRGHMTYLSNYAADAMQSHYTIVDGVIYTRDMKTLCRYPPKKRCKKFIIPDGVVSIGESAFERAHELEEVYMPDSVKNLGFQAFACSSVRRVRLSKKIKKIPDKKKYGCFERSAIEEIIIPKNVKYIGERAFYDTKLKTVTFMPGSGRIIEGQAFAYTNLNDVTLPKSVKELMPESFNCVTLKEMHINGHPQGLIDALINSTHINYWYEDSFITIIQNGIVTVLPRYIGIIIPYAVYQPIVDRYNPKRQFKAIDTFEIYEIYNHEMHNEYKENVSIEILKRFSKDDKTSRNFLRFWKNKKERTEREAEKKVLEACRQYLRENGYEILSDAVNRDDTERLIELLNLVDFDRETIERVLDETEDAEKRAYILKSMASNTDKLEFCDEFAL